MRSFAASVNASPASGPESFPPYPADDCWRELTLFGLAVFVYSMIYGIYWSESFLIMHGRRKELINWSHGTCLRLFVGL
ncbi:hypothetical protein AFLA_009389 [Aspergillus flavus NRRL3357]|nr:hypothetical protein AFLA_009389 [Aspergillus flavus NRRL3357]